MPGAVLPLNGPHLTSLLGTAENSTETAGSIAHGLLSCDPTIIKAGGIGSQELLGFHDDQLAAPCLAALWLAAL